MTYQSELTRGKKTSLSKALLNSLSLDRKSGFEIYKKYFLKFCLVEEEVNVCCFQRSSGAEKRIRKKLYNQNVPQADPAFFNFFSHFDVNRVSKACNKEIVIYSAPHISSSIKSASVLHDFRHVRSTEWSQKAETFYYLFTYKDLKLYQLDSSLASQIHISDPFFAIRRQTNDSYLQASSSPTKSDINYAQLIEDHLDLDQLNKSIELPKVSEAKCLDDFSEQLYNRWKKKILIVAFARLLKKGNWERKKLFSDCYFATLGLIAPISGAASANSKKFSTRLTGRKRSRKEMEDKDEDEDEEIMVISLWNKNQVSLLKPEFSRQLIDRHFDTTGLKERRTHRLGFFGSRKISEEQRLEAKKIWSEKRDERARQRRKEFRAGKIGYTKKSVTRLCRCKICRSCQFDENMAPSGPEQLCTTEYSLSNCLQMLGALDANAIRNIDLMCRLSIASMDIESKTVDVDLGSPLLTRENVYAEIDSAKLEGYIKKAQHPIMIAHVDYKSTTENQEKKILTVENDTPEACYQMMRKYWDYVLERQRLAQEEKLRLALPYYKLVASYRKSFFETVNQWFKETKLEFTNKSKHIEAKRLEDPESSLQRDFEQDILSGLSEKFEYNIQRIAAAWKATLPGKLEEALDRLVDAYEIFSFYG